MIFHIFIHMVLFTGNMWIKLWLVNTQYELVELIVQDLLQWQPNLQSEDSQRSSCKIDFTNFFYYFRQIKNHIVLYLFYSIKGDRVFEYEGDRTRDDIVNFALRVMGPAVTQLNTIGDFEEAKKRTELFFMFSGVSEGSEWVWISEYI